MIDHLPALIARLEAATGPSRELDCEIAEQAGWAEVGYRPKFVSPIGFPPHGKSVRCVPRYTASLDAALTLVPEDWKMQGQIAWPGYDDGKFINDVRVELHHVVSSGGGPMVTALAKTIAIAICLAALKARLA